MRRWEYNYCITPATNIIKLLQLTNKQTNIWIIINDNYIFILMNSWGQKDAR